MKMSKRQYRIGDVAKELKLKKFVLRFWEKELNLTPHRSIGGQRFYQEDDFETFKLIKSLLYDRKFTLAGAKKELESLKSHKKLIIPSQKTEMNLAEPKPITVQKNPLEIQSELLALQEKLKRLQEML